MFIFIASTETRDRTSLKILMKSFYNPLKEEEKPRILTIARSHPNFCPHPRAHIVLVHDCSLFEPEAPGEPDKGLTVVHKPMELVALYDVAGSSTPSTLTGQLKKIDVREAVISKCLREVALVWV
jgi:hypothetical protein